MLIIGRYGKLGNMTQSIPQESVDFQIEIPPTDSSELYQKKNGKWRGKNRNKKNRNKKNRNKKNRNKKNRNKKNRKKKNRMERKRIE
jgi:hypothetical protein